MKEFKVLMFGPQRVGKTSVLSSMLKQFKSETAITDINISLTPDEITKDVVEAKIKDLKEIFDKKASDKSDDRWTIDTNKTPAKEKYRFIMSVAGAADDIGITFTDIPGEWLREQSKKTANGEIDNVTEKELQKELQESSVIIVAIDTPHLMEENGMYHDACNFGGHVNRLIQQSSGEKMCPKLVLFVPLKCEKYYHEGRMDEVNKAVKDKYKMAIASMSKGEKAENYMVAITPIITLGGVVFDDFGRDSEGYVEIITDNAMSFSKPEAAFYKLYDKAPKFAPKFCEQPLLYILKFILDITDFEPPKKASRSFIKEVFKPTKGMKSIYNKIMGKGDKIEIGFEDLLLLNPQILIFGRAMQYVFTPEAQNNIQEAVLKLKVSGSGYEVLQNPFEK